MKKEDKKTIIKLKKLHKVFERNTEKIFIILISFLLIISIINLIPLSSTQNFLKSKIEKIKEENKPAEIELFTIKADCIKCFDISSIVESVKKENVKLIREEELSANSDRAKQLIEEYGIEKLPTVLVFGEINKTNLNGFKDVNDALVFGDVKPLYVDVKTNEIKGEVKIIHILDSSCEKCASLNPFLNSLGEAGVAVTDLREVEYNSAEGRSLIAKFGVKQIPALLISNDINYYDSVRQSLLQLNLEEKQGYYALHSTVPPYRDLTKNKIAGLVEFIMLKDESCNECYNVLINKEIVQRLGVVINNEKTYDVSSSEGKQLISKYNIQKVPIIILSPEASVYNSFVQAWKSVGSVESDSWFIMRSPEALGKTKTL